MIDSNVQTAIETESNPRRIETGRSWRDLPPAPPSTAPLRPSTPPAPVATTQTRSWPWGRIGLGAAALLVGITVGVWAPWANVDTASPQPLAADELPETIVPDPPPELAPDPAPSDEPFLVPPEDFDTPEEFFDQLPEGLFDQIPPEFLDQLPEGFFDGLPGGGLESSSLITFEDLPDGYQARSNVFSESNDRASQRIRLLGPDGAVDVQAIRGPDVSLPATGEPFSIGGAEGRLVTSEDSVTLSWLAEDDLLITIEAGPGVDVDTLAAIADAVEVAP